MNVLCFIKSCVTETGADSAVPCWTDSFIFHSLDSLNVPSCYVPCVVSGTGVRWCGECWFALWHPFSSPDSASPYPTTPTATVRLADLREWGLSMIGLLPAPVWFLQPLLSCLTSFFDGEAKQQKSQGKTFLSGSWETKHLPPRA